MGKQIKKKDDHPSDDKQKDLRKEAYEDAEEDIEKDPDLRETDEEDLDEGELARLDNSND